MRPMLAAWLLFGAALAVTEASARAQAPPASQPTSTSPAVTSQPAATDDVRQQLAELQARLAALEAKHSEERELDRRRIAELEAKVAELQGPSLEVERLEALRQQVAEIRREIQREAGTQPTSQPKPSRGAAEDELAGLLGEKQPLGPAEAKPAGLGASLQRAIQSFNPDISVNGDFLGRVPAHQGKKPAEKLMFRELEIGLSGAVDPYTRADAIFTVSRGDHKYEADLEEAYLTYLGLPFNLQARFGQMRAEFGRANAIHLHALPWVEYPFVIQRLFGKEGLSGAGAELSWLVPNPWNQYIAITYELLSNDNDTLFAGDRARDFTNLVRVRTFRDLTPTSTLEFGGSFATAPNDAGHGGHRSLVEGFDLTYRWKPKEAGLYKSFLWQNEILFAQADIRGGQESTWGMYSAAEYQFARQWKLGARYDNAQLPGESSASERGYSAYLTFIQSEFVFWRLAYVYTDRNFQENGVRNNQEIMLQLNWTLGAHPAHRY